MVVGDLAARLEDRSMGHVRAAPDHPQGRGKIERWHRTLTNRIPLESGHPPGDIGVAIGAFADHDGHCRYYESFGNFITADVYVQCRRSWKS